jgi:hypothetical protein
MGGFMRCKRNRGLADAAVTALEKTISLFTRFGSGWR